MLAKNASATGDRHIFLNPGGPGASGVGFLRGSAYDLNKLIGEGFHLLSFDPRGVSGSIPKAVCYPSNSERAAAFASTPWDLKFQAGEMYTRAENKVKACEDMMGEHGKYISTLQIAADMNSILDAIGQQQIWNYTRSDIYAMFPERVSRMVLDGVSNLDEWCGIDAEYYPSARGSAVSTLSVEEEDLLSSLHALATKDVFLVRSQV
ncbi:hypothetical protein BDQ94DRAFT_171231 [Aspergillus welwitschiae]|uniref:Uncharacterized protein n=1 Tax=Aspergillus welwitschiae TaxID=1341132 RepID=A0A3F3PZX4_9EURO|nr:hypothetical protein BDQ94DRAFT_171231 [Aspergillus welwitschiae]RDH32470.1 hypothetical protein BDQ94DRAFT_171231 [Aspergillus welwitschiae]